MYSCDINLKRRTFSVSASDSSNCALIGGSNVRLFVTKAFFVSFRGQCIFTNFFIFNYLFGTTDKYHYKYNLLVRHPMTVDSTINTVPSTNLQTLLNNSADLMLFFKNPCLYLMTLR